MSLPNTMIVRDLTPTARVFGIEYQDLIFVLALFLPLAFLVWVIFPPWVLTLDIFALLGSKRSNAPLSFNLVPWLPSFLLWLMLAIFYLQFRQNQPRGFLQDLLGEVANWLEASTGGPDPNHWEGGRPDTQVDQYLLEE